MMPGRLIAEQRELEASRRAKLEAAELQAVQRDRLWQAALPSGIPAGMIPQGLTPAEAFHQAELDRMPFQPQRWSLVLMFLITRTVRWFSTRCQFPHWMTVSCDYRGHRDACVLRQAKPLPIRRTAMATARVPQPMAVDGVVEVVAASTLVVRPVIGPAMPGRCGCKPIWHW